MEFDFVALIQNMGFPIATAVALGWYVYKTQKETRADFLSRENKILEANDKLAVALDKSADAITEATRQHSVICDRLCVVEQKVDGLHKKVDELSKD